MKPKFAFRSLLLASSILTAQFAGAATYYWDNNSTTAGFGTALGTWATDAFWTTDGTGAFGVAGISNPTTVDILNFGNSSMGLSAGTITISGTVDAGNMIFGSGSGSIALSSGTINLAAAQTTTVNNATNTISSILSGAGTSFTKAGSGILILSGANSYTGTTVVNRGNLTLNSATGSLATTSPLTFSGTGTFNMDNVGASGAIAQTLGALTFSAGQGTVQLTRTADFDQTLTFSSLAVRAAGASGNFVNNGGTNSASNGFIFASAPTAGTLIDRGVFFNGSSYATYDSGGYIRAFDAGDTNYLAAPTGTTIGASTASSNVDLTTGNITAQTTISANTINMRNYNITMSGTSQILSVNGLLSSGSSTASLGGGTTPLLQAGSGGGELVIRVNGSPDILTVSSVIQNNTSASRLTKSGDGTLILTGTPTYTGVTSINAGTLQLGNGGATGILNSGSTVVNNGSLSINHTSAQTLAVISGSGNVIMSGTNTLTLNSGNTFSGGFTLNSGTISPGAGTYNGFGTGLLTLNGGSFRTTSAFTVPNEVKFLAGSNVTFDRPAGSTPAPTFAGNVELGGNVTLTLGVTTTAAAVTFSGNISDPAGDFKITTAGTTQAANSLTFSGDNSNWSGGLTANIGSHTIGLNSATALGTGTFTIGNTIFLDNTSAGAITLTTNNAIAVNSNFTFTGTRDLNMGSGAVNLGAGTRTITTTAGTLTLGGAISNGGLTKSGVGTLALGGSSSNTYATVTTMAASQGGTLQLAKSGSAQAIANGGLTIGGADNSLAKVTYTGGSSDMMGTGTVTINGRSRFDFNGHTDTIGNVVIVNTGAISDVNSILNTAGTGNLTIGTLGITPVANLATQINAGTSGTITLGGNVTFTAATTGRARITGQNLALGAATRTFTIAAGTGLGYDMLIDAAISGTGVGLIKAGAGRLVLGASNSYNGLTTVSAGQLIATDGSALAGGGGLTVNANQAFIYAPTAAGALNLGSGVLTLSSGTTTNIGTVVGGTLSQSAIISSSAASLAGTGVVNVRLIPGVSPAVGTNDLITASGGLTGGTYTLGAVYNNTDYTISNFTHSATAISVDVATATALSGNVYWQGGIAANTGVWSATNGSTQGNWQSTQGINQGLAPNSANSLIFAPTSPTTMVGMTLGANMEVDSLRINNTVTAFGLSADGNTLTITPSSSANGITIGSGVQATSISAPLVLGAAQTWTNNSINAFTVNGAVNNSGNTLTIAGSGTTNITAAGSVISGSGGVTMNGSGRLIMGSGTAPSHTYSGATILNGGVTLFSSNLPASSNLTLNGGVYEDYWTFTMNRSLGAGAGQVQILGGASGFSENGSTGMTVNLGGSSATVVWGSSFFNPSTLVLEASSAQSGSTLDFQNPINLNGSTRTIASYKTSSLTSGATISGAITNSTGTAGLIKAGPGILTLTAANTYNGDTSVTGILSLSGSGTINNTSALRLDNGTLRLINTAQVNRFADGAAVTVSNAGTISYENTAGANLNYTETLGSVGVSEGQFNVVLTGNQNNATNNSQILTLGGLSRPGSTNRSAITFSAATTGPQVSSGDNMIVVTGGGSTNSNEIIGPWATVGTTAALQTDYAVYASNYVTGRATGATVDDSTWSATWAATSNYNFANGTAGLTISGGTKNINTLQHTGGAETLTVASGNNLGTYGILNGSTSLFTISATGTGAVTLPTTTAGSLYVTTGSGAITINAPIADNTGALTLVKSGTGGTLILGAANNSFTGDIIVNAGTLQVGVSGSAAQLNGGNYAGNIFIAAGAALTLQGDSSNTLSGNITGDGNLNINRGSTVLSGNNTYTGKTTFGLVATNAVGNTVSVSSFNSVVGGTASSSLGAPTTVANGTIDFGGAVQVNSQITHTGPAETTDRVINFVFNGTGTRILDASGSGLLKFTSAFTSNGTATSHIQLQGSSSGELVGGLPFSFTNLTKSGNGTWTLGDTVGSTGVLTVNGGTLALQKTSSLMGGNTTNWTAAKINVKSGATLALNVDSAGMTGFNGNDLNTLYSAISVAGSASVGLQSGAKLGLDTSTATGGTFTQGNAIANSTGANGGAIGLTKLGTGTLVLDKTNTYTGTTTVSNGTLVVNGNISTSSLTTVASVATLGGSGTLGAVTIDGSLAPGNSIGTITATGDVTWNDNVDWAFELGLADADLAAASDGSDNDLLNITGATSDFLKGSGSTFTFDFGGLGEAGWYKLVDWAGTTNFVAGDFAWTNLGGGLSGSFTVDSGTSALYLTVAPIPEPGAALLGGLGILLILRRRR